MVVLLATQIDSAIALQSLALPGTLILCIVSMLREQSMDVKDEKRLVRLYKQHALLFELIQFFVALLACGYVAGNTVAAWAARSLVLGFASEDVTSMIVRSAIARNLWLCGSAMAVLTCMSMLDSWSLPTSMQDITDPLFRLTRELVRRYVFRHDHAEYNDRVCCEKPLTYDIEQPHMLSPLENTRASRNPSDNETCLSEQSNNDKPTTTIPSPQPPSTNNQEVTEIPAKTTPTKPPPSPSPPPSPTGPPPSTKDPQTPPSKAQTPPTAHPPASHPHYQNQTLTSALRASPKSPKANRSRKRSVTFAVHASPTNSGSARTSSRERSRSLVRERKLEFERRVQAEEGGWAVEGRDGGESERSDLIESIGEFEPYDDADQSAVRIGAEVTKD